MHDVIIHFHSLSHLLVSRSILRRRRGRRNNTYTLMPLHLHFNTHLYSLLLSFSFIQAVLVQRLLVLYSQSIIDRTSLSENLLLRTQSEAKEIKSERVYTEKKGTSRPNDCQNRYYCCGCRRFAECQHDPRRPLQFLMLATSRSTSSYCASMGGLRSWSAERRQYQ